MTGTVQAFALACGYLFVVLYGGFLSGVELAAVRQLPRHQRQARCCCSCWWPRSRWRGLAAIARPLLFASVDPDVAAARGVPVRGLSVRVPRAAGRRRRRGQPDHRDAAGVRPARRPGGDRAGVDRAAGRSGPCSPSGSAVGVVWSSLFVAYFSPYPIGFLVTSVAFAVYLLAVGPRRLRATGRRGCAEQGMTGLLAVGTGLGDLFAQPFMRHAFLAGVPIAALSGLVGYFVVLRSQVFTGDALSHVAFTGALGALAFGLDARLGLFVATVAVGVGLGLLGNRGRADDVVIGDGVRLGPGARRARPVGVRHERRGGGQRSRRRLGAVRLDARAQRVDGMAGRRTRGRPRRRRPRAGPTAAVREHRRGGGRGPRSAGPAAGRRLPRRRRADRRRGDPGGRRAAARGPARRARRRRAAAHRPAVRRDGAVLGDRGRSHGAGSGRQLRRPGAAAELLRARCWRPPRTWGRTSSASRAADTRSRPGSTPDPTELALVAA